MKQRLRPFFAVAALVTWAVSACVPLDIETGESTPAVSPPMVEPIPSIAVPDLELYTQEGLAERVMEFSMGSHARQLLDGSFRSAGVVNDSAKLLFAESSHGDQQALIPFSGGGLGFGVYVWCSEETRFNASFVDGKTGREFGSVGGSCAASSSSGGATGNTRIQGPIYLTVTTVDPVPIEVVAYSFQSTESG
ncbi:hypothetical protein CQ018_02965 [Arthrobacter sp. MYb227]|uniref:hypothetical protein n=1 Tax=Arthrobacter sp. MYb227 TaxID=1848601 RepID=UPI000D4D0D33|nr:hypothetical protein [Arthrobacter sp. MYb227]PQZ96251.1 hypothetical protein CQ018_02965 [Arthrobacter sp. MYb227]